MRRPRILPAFTFKSAEERDDVFDLACGQVQAGARDLEGQVGVRDRAAIVELNDLAQRPNGPVVHVRRMSRDFPERRRLECAGISFEDGALGYSMASVV